MGKGKKKIYIEGEDGVGSDKKAVRHLEMVLWLLAFVKHCAKQHKIYGSE
jgi:hypothetical protein